MLTVSPSPGRNAGFRPLSLRVRGLFYSIGERMTRLGLKAKDRE